MLSSLRVSSLATIVGLALAATAAVPSLKADEFNKKTTMTFSAPVEISGRTLPAGTYVFKTLQSDQDIIVITDHNDQRFVALVKAIPVQSTVIPGKTEVQLSEGTRSGTEVMRAWFYPGYTTGWEFPAAK